MKRKDARHAVSTLCARFGHLARERGRKAHYRKIEGSLTSYDEMEWIAGQGDGEKVASHLAAVLSNAFSTTYGGIGDVSYIEEARKFVEDNRVLIAEVALTFVPVPMPERMRRRQS